MNNIRCLGEQYERSLQATWAEATAGAAPQPFLIMSPLYQIIASDWAMTSSYLNRELKVIEFNLEIAHYNISRRKEYLDRLTAYRRRISCYLDLVNQQLALTETFGRKSWRLDKPSTAMKESRKLLCEDFRHVLKLLRGNAERIKQNLELLLILKSVYQGQETTSLSKNMANLTLANVLFLPFGCIAAVLGIQGDYGPGGKYHWVYWAILSPMIVVLILLHIRYNKRESRVYTTHKEALARKSRYRATEEERKVLVGGHRSGSDGGTRLQFLRRLIHACYQLFGKATPKKTGSDQDRLHGNLA
jgi:hypothetical protein